jgi:hypothetical protein
VTCISTRPTPKKRGVPAVTNQSPAALSHASCSSRRIGCAIYRLAEHTGNMFEMQTPQIKKSDKYTFAWFPAKGYLRQKLTRLKSVPLCRLRYALSYDWPLKNRVRVGYCVQQISFPSARVVGQQIAGIYSPQPLESGIPGTNAMSSSQAIEVDPEFDRTGGDESSGGSYLSSTQSLTSSINEHIFENGESHVRWRVPWLSAVGVERQEVSYLLWPGQKYATYRRGTLRCSCPGGLLTRATGRARPVGIRFTPANIPKTNTPQPRPPPRNLPAHNAQPPLRRPHRVTPTARPRHRHRNWNLVHRHGRPVPQRRSNRDGYHPDPTAMGAPELVLSPVTYPSHH